MEHQHNLKPFSGALDAQEAGGASNLKPFSGELDGQTPRRSLIGAVNDTVIEVANAAAGTVSAVGNFVRPGNAASGWIDKNIIETGEAKQSDVVKAEKTRYAQEMQDAQGTGNEVGATLGYVARNPLLSAAQAAGSFAAPGLAIKGANRLAQAAGLGAKGTTRAGLAAGAALGGAGAGGDAAGTAYELSREGGATEEQAVEAARGASVIPGVIGAAGGLVGAERLVSGAKGFGGGLVSRALKTGAVEGTQEAIEEGVTQYEGQRAAVPFNPDLDPMKGVAGAATMGAVLGGGTGAGASLLTGQNQPPIRKPSEDLGLNPDNGPLSKVAAVAVDGAASAQVQPQGVDGLSLEPEAQDLAPKGPSMAERFEALPQQARAQADQLLREIADDRTPEGVKRFRANELQQLLDSNPMPQEQSMEIPEEERIAMRPIVHGFDPATGQAPEQPLGFTDAHYQYEGGIDLETAVQPQSESAYQEAINRIALESYQTPGQPLAMEQASRLRDAAQGQGVPATIVPHPSGTGFDVQATAALPEDARGQVAQDPVAAALPYDNRATGRIVADAQGNARPELRPEAVERDARWNQERAQAEAEYQRRAELGLSNTVPVAPTSQETAVVPSITGQQMDGEWHAFAPESGTLGIPRAEMPQVFSEHRGALIGYLKGRGVESESGEVSAAELKPTQAEFSVEKVRKAMDRKGGERSILVSADGYVIDGHHQWMAKREAGEPVKVLQLQAPVRELLPMVSSFPSARTAQGATPEFVQQGQSNGSPTPIDNAPQIQKQDTAQGQAPAALQQTGGVDAAQATQTEQIGALSQAQSTASAESVEQVSQAAAVTESPPNSLASQDIRDLAQRFRERHRETGADTDRTFATVLDGFARDVGAGKRTAESVQSALERYQELANKPLKTKKIQTQEELNAIDSDDAALIAEVPKAKQSFKPKDDDTYSQTVAKGSLGRAERQKKEAFERVKRVRQEVRAGTANRLELLKAEDAHRSLVREVDAIKSTVPQFSRADAKPTAVHLRRTMVQRTIDSLSSGWSQRPPITVVDSMSDLQVPQAVRESDQAQRSQGATGEPEGFWYRDHVYLVASTLPTSADATRVLYHEVLGHHGLRGHFGKDLDRVLDQVAKLRRDDVKAKAAEYGLDMAKPEHVSYAAEEVLAEMAQTRPDLGFVQRAIAAIRNFLRTHVAAFKTLELSDTDIVQAYLLPARGWVERGGLVASTDTAERFSRSQPADAITSSMGQLTTAQERAYRAVAGFDKVPTVKERFDTFKANLGMRMKQALVDQFAPIAQLDQNAYMLARMSKGSDGTLEAALLYGRPFLRDGVPDVDVKEGGFAKVLAGLKGEHDRFLMWVAAQRAEGLKAQGKENLFSDQDITSLKTLNDGQMQDGSSRKQAYVKALSQLNSFNESVLRMAKDSGLIDQDAYDLMKDQPYVPFYRLMEEEGGLQGPSFSKGLTNQKAWKKLKGGTEQLNADLLQNMLLNWGNLYAASARNRAALATMDAADKMAVAYKVPSDTKGAAKLMRDGMTEHWLVEDPYLLEAISALHYQASPLMKPLAKAKQWLTIGVTVNPTFKVRNLIRDVVSSMAMADLSYNPVANVSKGWKLTARDSQVYASMLASGGVIKFGTQEQTDRARKEVAKLSGVTLDQNGAQKLWGQVKALYAVYDELGDRTENVNRTALYDRLIANGHNHAEASFMARDLMDFSMGGNATLVRFLTQSVPFLNARMQGLYKLGRAAKEDPRRFATVAMAVSVASLGLLAAYADDEDWKRREDWDRDSYWWFKIGETAYRIPKPFEVGAIGTLAERTAEALFDDEMDTKRFMERITHMVSQTFAFDPVPQLFKPLLDIYSNKDSFTGRAIESQADQRLRPEDRYNERTSEVARFLGQMGLPDPAQLVKGEYTGLSPKQVDHLLRGYFSWIATASAVASNAVLRNTVVDRGESPDLRLKDMFLAGNFVESLPTGSSRYVSAMYEQSRAVEQAYASYRDALASGDHQEVADIMGSDGDKIRSRASVATATKLLAQLNAQAKRVQVDTQMDGSEKRERLTRIEQRRHEIAKRVMGSPAT